MFARRLNELRVSLELAPRTPLLIKEGRHMEADPEDPDQKPNPDARCFHRGVRRTPPFPRSRHGRGYSDYDTADDCFDMAFVWTQTAAGPRFYLPGSSLRGVLRSTVERLVGRWRPDWTLAGDPFTNATQRWVQEERQLGRSLSGEVIYRMSGPIERCFGHTALRGRWTVADAWMRDEQQAGVVVRDGVGIDRKTGAAATNIKFQFEAITSGVFETTLILVNYELWQLGLLAYALEALDEGQVRLGYGTRRGLGRVRVAVPRISWRWYGSTPDQHDGEVVVPSLEQLATATGLRDGYGWRDTGQRLLLPLVGDTAPFGSAWRIDPARASAVDGFAPTDWEQLPWPRFAQLLPPVLEGWPMPPELQAILSDQEAA